MDAVYLYRHSPYDDFEIRYSLRSLERHAPYIRKVWIFGDRPSFLTDDCAIAQHVPHEYTARILGIKPPVTNFGMLMVLASLIPELEFEYLQWSDDHFLLQDFPVEEARKARYIEDMEAKKPPACRGIGQWKQTLWRTVDTLLRLGYTAYNFESHTPRCLTRKMVFEAYSDFREFFTQDRFFGVTGPTAIMNHAHRRAPLDIVDMQEENSRCGWWRAPPASYEEVVEASAGKRFLNFDDDAFGDALRTFLTERFPEPSKFEKTVPCAGESPTDQHAADTSENIAAERLRQQVSSVREKWCKPRECTEILQR